MQKILVVDDDPVTRRLISAALENRGYVTIQAADGARALQVAHDNRDLALVITDYEMPNLSGADLVGKLSLDVGLRQIPIVMTSGVVRLTDISNVLEKGVAYFLTKPLNVHELEEYVARALQNGPTAVASTPVALNEIPIAASHLEICCAAMIEVIQTMSALTLAREEVFLKPNNKTWGDVNALVGLVGETHQGSMMVGFDQGSILQIVSAMLQESFTELNRDVIDAVGEIANMVSSRARAILSEHGVVLGMARPVLLEGRGVAITQLEQGTVLSIPFAVPQGRLVLEIDLVPRASPSSGA